ncbi:MAG: DUF479 domain-containing protein [Gammaproteobacteria bacterium]|nr:DUF479 domain-containing protein [Gammaproteobacteria bacterium]
MHKEIDKFTDKHPLFKQSKARLGRRGYLRGVVIDVIYDYMLCKSWSDFSSVALDEFINKFHQEATLQIEHYPDKAKNFISKVIQHNALRSYSSIEGLVLTFQRIDKRLSDRIKAKESMFDYIPKAIDQLENIEYDFNKFFPELIKFAESTNSVEVNK